MNWPVNQHSARASRVQGTLARRTAIIISRFLCPIVLFMHIPAARGQVVSGIVVDSATGVPVNGTVVVLLRIMLPTVMTEATGAQTRCAAGAATGDAVYSGKK